MKRQITFPREVLLVEIERRCRDPRCRARTHIGLTKMEARAYKGFVCERCERRHDEDVLGERDIPDWWEELKVNAREGARPGATRDGEMVEDDASRSREGLTHFECDGENV